MITERGQTNSFVTDGVEVMAGINIRLGGNTGSLADIDRSNAIDTRAWECPPAAGHCGDSGRRCRAALIPDRS
jgi:hypothetical protein